MAPLARSKFRWTTIVAIGCKRIGSLKRTNKRILVHASICPCKIEEKMTLVNVDGEEIERYETKVTNKDGYIIRYPRKCPKFLEDGGEVWAEPHNLYGFVDRIEEEERNLRSGFASRPLPQNEGNRNGWISEEEEYEVDSDLESTASSRFNPS